MNAMRFHLAAVAFFVGVCWSLGASAGEVACAVKYLSAEHIYLDAGSAQQLVVGLIGKVVRDGQAVAEIELVYVAERSATAQLKTAAIDVVAGDRVVFTVVDVAPSAVEPAAEISTRTRDRNAKTTKRRTNRGPNLRGSVALQWDHATEDNDRRLQTDIVRLPFRVEAKDAMAGFTFRARGSLRHHTRSGFSANTPSKEWRNRIYEVALLRENHDHQWHYAVGRIGGRASSGAGSFDGARISRRMGARSRLGVFGGFAPTWGDLGFGTDDHLVGVDYRFTQRDGPGRSFDLSLAGIGRYRSGEISREYVTMITNWRGGGGLSLLQAAEVDFNRGWRRDAGARTVVLSSFALSGRYQFATQVAADLGYDNRDPVRTWETRSLPDSLFQGAGRQGLRAGLRLRPGYRMTINLSASLRRDDRNNDKIRAWRMRWTAPDLVAKRTTIFASLRGFDGPWLTGWAPSFGVSHAWDSGLHGRLEGGHYSYTGVIDDTTRDNSWAMVGLAKNIYQSTQISADYRQDWGDDIVGSRWFLELRQQF